MNQYTKVNAKSWTSLNQQRKAVRGLIVNHNRTLVHRAKDKIATTKTTLQVLSDFDAVSKPIKNRRIDLLDEAICDFLVDHVYNLDNQESKFVCQIMNFYHDITGCRA